LSNPTLKAAIAATGDADLQHSLAWSEAVNAAIAAMVRNVPPFPFVRESLERLKPQADLLVASATPTEALVAEWHEHDLAALVRAIYGQELGTKREMLAVAAGYAAERALMIGDAPGDYNAAVANRCLFFPINPGSEEASWRRLLDEGIDRFVGGAFAGAYQGLGWWKIDADIPARAIEEGAILVGVQVPDGRVAEAITVLQKAGADHVEQT
jgi:hypothetical protein